MNDNSRRPRVLVCDPIDSIAIDMLQEHAEVDIQLSLSSEELLDLVPKYEGLLVYRQTPVTAEVVQHGVNLMVIGRAGARLDNIAVQAAEDAGISVVNSPDANTLAVAEHTLALMLVLARQLPLIDHNASDNTDEKLFLGTGLAGKNLGIIGFGRIGSEVAIRAKAFGMRVFAVDINFNEDLAQQIGVEFRPLPKLLVTSDFVTLHVPLSENTRQLIGAEQLGQLKSSAFFINTADAQIVDANALLQVLNAGKISGVALDLILDESPTSQALIQHKRVIATPRVAAKTEDAARVAAITVVDKMIDQLRGAEPMSILPLLVVPIEAIFPHESIDQKRVDRLADRLKNETILQNPPLVLPVGDDKYMVLDGATRTAALNQLGFPHVVVQIIDHDDDLRLKTWFHVIRQIDAGNLLDLFHSLPLITLSKSSAEKAAEEMFVYDGLCYIHLADDNVYVAYAAPDANRLEAMNSLTEAYIDAESSLIARTLEENIYTLQHIYEDMTALVVFPELTVPQVIQIARSGHYVPAGITRFIISGRILRVNAGLDMLKSDKSLREKNRWLHELLQARESRGKIRYYGEPVYLLDE